MGDHTYSEGTPFADEIHRDFDVLRTFESENPGVLVDLKLSHEPRAHLAVLLASGATDDVVTSLRRRLIHGNHLEVEFSTVTRDELENVHQEISLLIRDGDPRALRESAIQWGQVHIRLRADQLRLAGDLRARYGDVIRLEVGSKPFPPQSIPARVEQPQSPQPRRPQVEVPGLIARLFLDQLTIASGNDGRARVRFENRGEELISISTGSPLTARLVDPVSKRIAGFFDGAIGGVGVTLRLAPGDVETLPVILGTTSPPDEVGFSVPPGRYLVEVDVPVYGEPDESGVPSASVLKVGTESINVTET